MGDGMTPRTVIGTVAALALLNLASPSLGQERAQYLGASPTSEELVKALKPSPAKGAIFATRGGAANTIPGMRVESAAAHPRPAPAVALDVKFALNSAELTEGAKLLAKELATAINSAQLSGDRFRLEGHADSTGDTDFNRWLSRRRAEAVRAYMIRSLGVAPQRIEAVGRGSDAPLDAAHPESGVNRRVQVVNISAK
jgi:outer membrane protein OmpA-like peptidoglycan-associated protein